MKKLRAQLVSRLVTKGKTDQGIWRNTNSSESEREKKSFEGGPLKVSYNFGIRGSDEENVVGGMKSVDGQLAEKKKR
ncbi:hypothetical protein TWF281_011188 [Arthrobotrys megalospora]